jgi:SSS family solute:Na+ symporter
VLQFFVILAGLIPIVVVGLTHVGGWSGLQDKVEKTSLGRHALDSWSGTGIPWSNPLGDWIGIVFGLGFVLSFGYWTTNFTEVQRALSARDLSAAQRTPLIGAFPKIFIPFLTIIPGLIALVVIPGIGAPNGDKTYNNAIPLMNQFLPNGVLGIALTGLLAAFMAGMAANVSSFNTVFTYDLWRPYVVKDRPDHYYLVVGRIITVVGVVIGIGTAFIASGYNNIMNYIQLLFSYFNAPVFATFIIGMFWKRTTPWAGFWGLVSGTAAAAAMHFGGYNVSYFYPGGHYDPSHATINAQMLNFYGAIAAFVVDAAVTVGVTLLTRPKPREELAGLVYGVPDPNAPDPSKAPKPDWWASPKILGATGIGITLVLSLIFI